MGWRSIVAVAILAAAIGGAAGSAVTLQLRDDNPAPGRGALVHVADPEWLAAYTPQPFCVQLHHFCIVQPETGHPVALYTYVPHPLFREWGCEVRFDPEAEWTNQDGTVIRGLFTDPCGGSRYDGVGHRVFGPSPTDLDTFPVTVTADASIVDTRTLVCGKRQLVDATYRCQRAPLGD